MPRPTRGRTRTTRFCAPRAEQQAPALRLDRRVHVVVDVLIMAAWVGICFTIAALDSMRPTAPGLIAVIVAFPWAPAWARRMRRAWSVALLPPALTICAALAATRPPSPGYGWALLAALLHAAYATFLVVFGIVAGFRVDMNKPGLGWVTMTWIVSAVGGAVLAIACVRARVGARAAAVAGAGRDTVVPAYQSNRTDA